MVGKNLLTPKPIRLEGGNGEYFSRCMLEGVVTLIDVSAIICDWSCLTQKNFVGLLILQYQVLLLKFDLTYQ